MCLGLSLKTKTKHCRKYRDFQHLALCKIREIKDWLIIYLVQASVLQAGNRVDTVRAHQLDSCSKVKEEGDQRKMNQYVR